MILTLKVIGILAIYPPLLAFIVVGIINKLLPDRFSQVITCGFMGIACISGLYLFTHIALQGNSGGIYPLSTWIQVGEFTAHWGMLLDPLNVTMIATVNLVSF